MLMLDKYFVTPARDNGSDGVWLVRVQTSGIGSQEVFRGSIIECNAYLEIVKKGCIKT